MKGKVQNMSNKINKDENTIYEVDLDCIKMNQCVNQSKKLHGMSRNNNNINVLYVLLLFFLKK